MVLLPNFTIFQVVNVFISSGHKGCTSTISLIQQWLYSPLLGHGLFCFCNHFYTDGSIPWKSDQPVARPLPTHKTTQTQNKRTQTSMSWMGFEPTIRTFERAKTVHALDRAATVIGATMLILSKIIYIFFYDIITNLLSLFPPFYKKRRQNH
jgi:hypothetical protein